VDPSKEQDGVFLINKHRSLSQHRLFFNHKGGKQGSDQV